MTDFRPSTRVPTYTEKGEIQLSNVIHFCADYLHEGKRVPADFFLQEVVDTEHKVPGYSYGSSNCWSCCDKHLAEAIADMLKGQGKMTVTIKRVGKGSTLA